MTVIQHKRGDSFEHVGQMPSNIPPGFFLGWTVVSELRQMGAGRLISTLETTWDDPITTQTLRLKCIDTTKWPIGPLEFDMHFIRNGDLFTRSTRKTLVNVSLDHV